MLIRTTRLLGIVLLASSFEIAWNPGEGPNRRCYGPPSATFPDNDCLFVTHTSDVLCEDGSKKVILDGRFTDNLYTYGEGWWVVAEPVTFEVSDTDIASFDLPSVPEQL